MERNELELIVMQKVYVTVEHDANGKEAVNEVFATYEAAVEYTITVLFAGDEFYSGREKGFLEAAAKNIIIERRLLAHNSALDRTGRRKE